MHACGHDGHTAILLTVAKVLAQHRHRFSGTVKFAFQPAEELPPGGARAMIEDGVLEHPKVDAVFGLHLWNGLPTGKIGVDDGPIMASADRFDIIVKGIGSHGAYLTQELTPLSLGAMLLPRCKPWLAVRYPP